MINPQFTPEELELEEWRPVAGFEGWYSVSNMKRVRRDMATPGTWAGRILKPGIKKGYPFVTLSRNGVHKTVEVHILVARAFLGPCPPGKEVNHIDADRANCTPKNLEYVTRKENMQHAKMLGRTASGDRNGTRTHHESVMRGDRHYLRRFPERILKGESVGTSRLTEDQVRAIRLADGTLKEIGERFDIDFRTVSLIKLRRRWKHVD